MKNEKKLVIYVYGAGKYGNYVGPDGKEARRTGQLKIGHTREDRGTDTKSAVEVRVKEQHPSEANSYYDLIHNWSAIKADGTRFEDHQFHAYLSKKGYERVLELKNDKQKTGEWFVITQKQVKREFGNFINGPVYSVLNPRAIQLKLKEDIMKELFVTDNLVLYYAMRTGKTILSLMVAKALDDNGDTAYLAISKNGSSRSSAEYDNGEYGVVKSKNFFSISLHQGTNNLLSEVQTIKGFKKIVVVIDEVDDSSHTKQSTKKLNGILNLIKITNPGIRIVTIAMTGTRHERGIKLLNSLGLNHKVLSCSYSAAQALEAKMVHRDFLKIHIASNVTDYVSFADSMKTAIGRETLGKSLYALLGENIDLDLDERDCKDVFVKIQSVTKGHTSNFIKYMNKKYPEYYFYGMNGNNTSGKQAETDIKNLKKIEKRPIVIISHGMATTSFSIPSIGRSIYMGDQLGADDIQALHRACTWTEGKDSADLIWVTVQDKIEWSSIFDDEVKATTNNALTKQYRELLKYNSIAFVIVDSEMDPNCEIRKYSTTSGDIEEMVGNVLKEHTKINYQVMKALDVYELGSFRGGHKEKQIQKAETKKGQKQNAVGDPIKGKGTNKAPQANLSMREKEKKLRAWMQGAFDVVVFMRATNVTTEDLLDEDTTSMAPLLFEKSNIHQSDFIQNYKNIEDFSSGFQIRLRNLSKEAMSEEEYMNDENLGGVA